MMRWFAQQAGGTARRNGRWGVPQGAVRPVLVVVVAPVVDDAAHVVEACESVLLQAHVAATHRRAWLSHARGSIGCDAPHGRKVVRRTHRRDAQPHGPADGSGRDLDGTPCERGAHSQRHPRYRSVHKDGKWLTMSEAAAALGVNDHRIRRLIKDGLLAAEQVVPRARTRFERLTWRIQLLVNAIARTDRPCRAEAENQISRFVIT